MDDSNNVKELLTIETDYIAVTIKGSIREVENKDSQLKVSCRDFHTCSINEANSNGDVVSSLRIAGEIQTRYNTIPLFYEQKKYELIIEYDNQIEVEFYHDNPAIRNAISVTGRKSKILSGMINFGNEIGLSDLIIKVNGKNYMTITVEVFPSKISYKKDYEEIMRDVTSEVYNLAFDFMRKTYLSLDVNSHKNPSYVEFFSIMDNIYERFIKATDLLISKPHHILQTNREVISSHKIKRTDNRTIKWLTSHPENIRTTNNKFVIEKALGVKKYVSYDTTENRFTKYILVNIVIKLNLFLEKYKNLQRETDPVIVAKISKMNHSIQARYNSGFLSDIQPLPSRTSMSLVFNMAPGYRELYRYYLLLQHGLSITDNLYKLSVKNVAELYEYWCFIKLNSLISDMGFRLVSKGILETNRNGLFVTLVKGKSSSIEYKNDKNERIVLSYNPKYNIKNQKPYPTIIEKPDNVLCLHKESDDYDYEYVFDAKYKIDDTEEYIKQYGGAGPKVDDINTMHRYRDSIVYKNNSSPIERIMFGAYVLFPYGNKEIEYQDHHFYKSINDVNIGGLPFLPSKTDLVRKHLETIISESPEDTFRKIPKGVDYRIHIPGKTKDIIVEIDNTD